MAEQGKLLCTTRGSCVDPDARWHTFSRTSHGLLNVSASDVVQPVLRVSRLHSPARRWRNLEFGHFAL